MQVISRFSNGHSPEENLKSRISHQIESLDHLENT